MSEITKIKVVLMHTKCITFILLKQLFQYLPVKVQLIKGLELIVETLEDKKDQQNFSGISGEEWLEIVEGAFQVLTYIHWVQK